MSKTVTGYSELSLVFPSKVFKHLTRNILTLLVRHFPLSFMWIWYY